MYYVLVNEEEKKFGAIKDINKSIKLFEHGFVLFGFVDCESIDVEYYARKLWKR